LWNFLDIQVGGWTTLSSFTRCSFGRTSRGDAEDSESLSVAQRCLIEEEEEKKRDGRKWKISILSIKMSLDFQGG